MPSWTTKDERQYEHVQESELERGQPEERAEEIAARTVDQQRSRERRTPSRRTQGTGRPSSRLEDRTRDELYQRARQLGIRGRSAMDKAELIAAIRAGRAG
jgi:hypothetical protein